MVRPEFSGPALKVVHFDRSGHFGRSDRNVPFHLTKLLFPVPLFCTLLTRTITKHAKALVGCVQPECAVPLGTWNFRNFKPEFLLNEKRRLTLKITTAQPLRFSKRQSLSTTVLFRTAFTWKIMLSLLMK